MRKILTSMILGIAVLVPFGMTGDGAAQEIRVETVGIQYGHDRPFSFYYPNQYQFYYPRHRYRSNSSSCYWLYSNGSYVYSCN